MAFLSPFSIWCTSLPSSPFLTFWSSKRNSQHLFLFPEKFIPHASDSFAFTETWNLHCPKILSTIFFFPFLETGSCVWLRTNSFSALGTYKTFGMRNGEVWGRLLCFLLSWGQLLICQVRLGSSWGWKTSQKFLVSLCWAQGLRESMFYNAQVAFSLLALALQFWM